jgi:hypothetical protein
LLTNIPTYVALNDAALSHHFFVWEKSLAIIRDFEEAFPGANLIALNSDEWKIEQNEFIEHSQRDLKVYSSILQQSNELALKARLCRESPYLLLLQSDSRHRFKQGDQDFNDLRTIGAVDLVDAVNVLTQTPLSQQFQSKFLGYRQDRNKILHLSALKKEIKPVEIIRDTIDFYTFLWPKRNWLADRIEFGSHTSESYFSELADMPMIAQVAYEWGHMERILTKRRFKELFGVEKSKRRYGCPICIEASRCDYTDWTRYDDAAFAYLSKQTTLTCLMCENDFSVSRDSCADFDCRGDVIFDSKVCLSCGIEQARV